MDRIWCGNADALIKMRVPKRILGRNKAASEYRGTPAVVIWLPIRCQSICESLVEVDFLDFDGRLHAQVSAPGPQCGTRLSVWTASRGCRARPHVFNVPRLLPTMNRQSSSSKNFRHNAKTTFDTALLELEGRSRSRLHDAQGWQCARTCQFGLLVAAFAISHRDASLLKRPILGMLAYNVWPHLVRSGRETKGCSRSCLFSSL